MFLKATVIVGALVLFHVRRSNERIVVASQDASLSRSDSSAEAIRVLKPGGTLAFIDFHRPQRFWRRALISVWFILEPFAKDLWSTEIQEWIPNEEKHSINVANIRKEELCGGALSKGCNEETIK